jgi:hypothetical protein
MTVVLRVILLTREESVHMRHDLNNMIKWTHMTYQTLSLLINIFATSLIALNAWCVYVNGAFGKYFVDYALIDGIKETPQVVDGKRIGYPKPYTGSKDTRSLSRVGYDLYSAWCKFRLGIQAWVFTNYIFFLGHERGLAGRSSVLSTWSTQ